MNIVNRTLVVFACFTFLSVNTYAGDFGELSKWVSHKEPFPWTKINGHDIWHVSSLKQGLNQTIGASRYKAISEDWHGPGGVRMFENYLLIDICKAHQCNINNILLVINLNTNTLSGCLVETPTFKVSKTSVAKKLFFSDQSKATEIASYTSEESIIPCQAIKHGTNDDSATIREFQKFGMK